MRMSIRSKAFGLMYQGAFRFVVSRGRNTLTRGGTVDPDRALHGRCRRGWDS